MTLENYNIKKNDPLFLYESVKICEACYKHVKNIIEFINLEHDDNRHKQPSQT